MATYTELFPLLQNSELRNKITVAVGVAAEIIREGNDTADPPWATGNHDNRLIWAARAYSNPVAVAREIQWSVIIANRGSSVAQILAAGDGAIQDNVNACVDIFATGS